MKSHLSFLFYLLFSLSMIIRPGLPYLNYKIKEGIENKLDTKFNHLPSIIARFVKELEKQKTNDQESGIKTNGSEVFFIREIKVVLAQIPFISFNKNNIFHSIRKSGSDFLLCIFQPPE